jgi:O-antigen ligase
MSLTQAYASPSVRPHAGAQFGNAAVWLLLAISGIVMIEPAPFDVALVLVAALFFLFGLRIPAWCVTPIALLIVFLMFGVIGAMQTPAMPESLRHVSITAYLAVGTLFFGCFVYRDPERALKLMLSGYAIAAAIAVIAGIIGYFKLLPGAFEVFTENSRARGTFKDPNVFGPFLIAPALYAFYRLVEGARKAAPYWGATFLLATVGILLSFSRGAWAHYLLSFAVCAFLLFVSSRSARLRFRITVSAVVLVLLGAIALAGIISLPQVSDLLSVRFQLFQDYDAGAGVGRLEGQVAAVKQILQNPLGIGAFGFAELWAGAPHNVYLYAFLIGGWIGGFAYVQFVLLTAVVGFAAATRPTPLRGLAIVLFSTFMGLILLGLVIDTDHWRHFYLLAGAIWGLAGYVMRVPAPARTRRPRRSRDSASG